MKAASFDYHAPEAVHEAVDLLHRFGDDAKVIAGGQSLVPMMALRLAAFPQLVDLRRIGELRGFDLSDDFLEVGAMTTQSAAERHEAVDSVPLLRLALPLIGHFQIRNRGTVGGSIAHADPSSELPAVALALDAEMEIRNTAGGRTVPAADFFLGTWSTALGSDEILGAVRFPVWPEGSGFAVEELARRHGDFAVAGAAVGVHVTEGRVDRAAIAMFGMDSVPVRCRDAEEALVAGASPAEAGQLAVAALDPPDDIHASSAYRLHVGAVLVRRAISRAIEETTHA